MRSFLKNILLFRSDILFETVRRFTLPAIFIILCVFILLALIHKVVFLTEDNSWRIILTLFSAIIFSTSLTLFSETHLKVLSKYREYKIFDFITFLMMGLVWVLFSGNVYSYYITFLFLGSGLLLSLMYSPYIGLDTDETDSCYFNTRLGLAAFFAGLTAFILCIGLSVVTASIKYLFDVNVSSKIYISIWAIGGALFAPFYFLSSIPKKYHFSKDTNYTYPVGIKFIVNYILVPLVVLYIAVLYAYIAKITILWELPKGNLAYMITGFGVVGVLTHLLAYPLYKEGNALLRMVCRYFYHALIIPVLLLCLGVWVRIEQYGVTESRYAIAIAALWLGISAIYVVSTKSEKLKLIPLFLSVLLIMASFGPWSAMNISAKSQVERLKIVLQKHNILVDGKIQKLEGNISFDEERNISSIIQYLLNTKKTKHISSWFVKKDIFKNTDSIRIYPQIAMNEMGLTYRSKWDRKKDKNIIVIRAKKSIYGLNTPTIIQGYDYFIPLQFNKYNKKAMQLTNIIIPNVTNSNIKVKVKNMNMIVTSSMGGEVSFNLETIFRQTWKDSIIFNAKDEDFRVQLQVNDIKGRKINNRHELVYIDFLLLIDDYNLGN